MTPGKRAGKVAAIAVALAAMTLAISGPAPVAGLAAGDSWTYVYYELSSGVEWQGNWTETFVGPIPGNLLAFHVYAGGVLSGAVNGTWSLNDFNAYRSTDGAFVNSTSVLELQYFQFGDFFDVVNVETRSNNPPVDLGIPLQVGATRSGTTTQIVTRTLTVNGTSTGPVTTSSTIVLTQTVVGRFQVSVPAGVFTAWQIRFTRSDTLPEYVESAYDETVGNSVRIQVFDAVGTVVASVELVDYGPAASGAPVAAPLGPLPYAAVGATAAVVALVVWWDRRRPPGATGAGPFTSGGAPPSQQP